jgi:UDPglucose 6-dehydrogenase
MGEPDVGELLAEHAGKHITATTDYESVRDTDVTLLALLTPSNRDGSIDSSYIEAAAESVGGALGDAPSGSEHVVATKSTVIPGTTEEQVAPAVRKRAPQVTVHVAANPEFLRMESAVNDFENPDKIVLGGDESAVETLADLYAPVRDETDTSAHLVTTGLREAEMVKYTNNSFLSSKVSIINNI